MLGGDDDAGEPAEVPLPPPLFAIVIYGPGLGRRVAISTTPVVIGRGEQCDLTIASEGLSRAHCLLFLDGDQAYVRDLGSVNGTYVDEQKISRAKVQLGDNIRLGRGAMLKVASDLDEHVCGPIYREDAGIDGLTRVSNMPAFREAVQREIERAHDEGRTFSLVAFDIDHLRKVNDTYGHLVGDWLLREVAQLLETVVPSDGVVARIGGEEFAVLLPNVDGDAAMDVADTMRDAVVQADFTREEVMMPATVSGGVGEWEAGILNFDALLRGVDQAMRAAKQAGRNRVCRVPSDPEPPSSVMSRRIVEMVAELHRRGYTSLALLGHMSPSGTAWRYELGVIPPSGAWGPHRLDPVLARGSMGTDLSWGDATDRAPALADKFVAKHADTLAAAQVENQAYVDWYRAMLRSLPPLAVFALASDHNCHERVEVVGPTVRIPQAEIPMPPGFRR